MSGQPGGCPPVTVVTTLTADSGRADSQALPDQYPVLSSTSLSSRVAMVLIRLNPIIRGWVGLLPGQKAGVAELPPLGDLRGVDRFLAQIRPAATIAGGAGLLPRRQMLHLLGGGERPTTSGTTLTGTRSRHRFILDHQCCRHHEPQNLAPRQADLL